MIDWTPDLGTSSRPRYISIAEAIERDVRAGTLSPGDRLPPQRKLAQRLGIDFTTVSRAYAEAQARGLVDSHVGRGTFVTAGAPGRGSAAGDAAGPVPAGIPLNGANGTAAPPPAAPVPGAPDPARVVATDLSMNMPPEPADPALLSRMQEGLSAVSANLVHLLRYQSATGSEKDRIAASTWLSLRGMVPRLERIAVTPGAHPTMTAILSILTRPGDTVLCERITYPGFRSIAGRMGLNLVGLEMDGDGILPDALERAIARVRPKALYLNPTLQNPTTITMPVERRLAISEVLNHHGLPLIEDDAYGFIPPKAPAPLAVSAPDLTWHIGGLAKCIGAGLRLAYTVAPSGRDAFALGQAVRSFAVMPSPLSMALATQWIEDGTADHIRRFIRSESAARQRIAAEALDGFEFRAADNAFNIWLSLPEGVGRSDIMARMAGREIGIMPSDAFTVDGPPDERLRVCLGGSITREALHTGLYHLADAMVPAPYMG
ncbi:aminotransferase-like domain-containing protein [Acuticoccus sediminis]|uniref:aminotransferase-like domain-containing protein n=1 Tax=Acuticoccus sediminis TaxID=2184697 RepID=UPI001CFDFF0F|nr:PLP-dependent aminotransferase family protein [Acuticoccus sediminis]